MATKEAPGKFRRLVMARAAEILKAAGPGELTKGSRGDRPRLTAARKWAELVMELERRSKHGQWRRNPDCARNLEAARRAQRRKKDKNG